MAFERSPGVALFFVLALLLFPMPGHADSADLLAPGDLPVIAPLPDIAPPPEIPVNDSLDIPVNVNIPMLDMPDIPMNDTGAAAEEPINASDNLTCRPAPDVQAEVPPTLSVAGTIYVLSDPRRQPWVDGHLKVYANGVPGEVNGATYSATIAPAEEIEVRLYHDCGYMLGVSTAYAGTPEGSISIDVEARALEVSGDVYKGDRPADGASLLVYLNDRPYGPINARADQGPMFSLSIPGGHPGDRVSITASGSGGSGIVCQDVSNYRVFLTVNLKDAVSYLPYATAPAEKSHKSIIPRKPRFKDEI